MSNKETMTFNQVNEQESSAYVSGSGAKPSVLIKRSDGRITVGNLEKDTQNVLFSEDGQDRMHPNVSMEKLSDQYQEKLAAELAGTLAASMAVTVESSVQRPSKLITAADVQAAMSTASPDVIANSVDSGGVAAESALEKEERLLAEFSESDRRALRDFAYSAHVKRDAQLNGEGDRSSDAGSDIADAYRRMSPEAQRRARGIAGAIYGQGKVAF